MGARQEERIMGVRVGIVGVRGYGGSELLRLCVGHPAFEVVYASGETTAGRRLSQQFPALAGHPTGSLVIQPFVPEELHGVDVLFGLLPRAVASRSRGFRGTSRSSTSAETTDSSKAGRTG
jgi:N-acetyl-gamma-glutamyl-phosphate reductase